MAAHRRKKTKKTSRPSIFGSGSLLRRSNRQYRAGLLAIMLALVTISGVMIQHRSHAASVDNSTWAPTAAGAYFFDRSNQSGNAQTDFGTRESQFGRKFDGHMYYLPFNVNAAGLADPHWSLATDKVPFVILSWSMSSPTTIIPDIASGKDDAAITNFAAAVKSQLSPYGRTFIRPFWEFNYTGSEFNDVNYSNNPTTFTAAWQRVVSIFRSNGVANVKWIWSPIRIGSNQSQNPVQYYPGAGYVDWIGIDAYPKNQFLTPQQLVTTSIGTTFDWYDTFKAYGKPLMLAETGIQPANAYPAGSPTRATWWNDLLTELQGPISAIRAVEYFDATGSYNWQYDAPGTAAGDSGAQSLAAAAATSRNCFLNVLNCVTKTPTPSTPPPTHTPTHTPTPTPTPPPPPPSSTPTPPSEGGGSGPPQQVVTPGAVFTPVDGTVTLPAGGSPTITGSVNVSSPACTTKDTNISVDAVKVSSDGKLNSRYITNGHHLVTVQSCDRTQSATIIIHNQLNLFEIIRNALFAGLRGHPALMNAGMSIPILGLLGAALFGVRSGLDYRLRHSHNQSI